MKSANSVRNTVWTKIFAPFDALAGFGDCIASKEIGYQEKRSLSEWEKEELDRKISILHGLTVNGKAAQNNCPKITVQYFVPCTDPNSDAYGTGGTYETTEGICQKVNVVSRTITFVYNRKRYGNIQVLLLKF